MYLSSIQPFYHTLRKGSSVELISMWWWWWWWFRYGGMHKWVYISA